MPVKNQLAYSYWELNTCFCYLTFGVIEYLLCHASINTVSALWYC